RWRNLKQSADFIFPLLIVGFSSVASLSNFSCARQRSTCISNAKRERRVPDIGLKRVIEAMNHVNQEGREHLQPPSMRPVQSDLPARQLRCLLFSRNAHSCVNIY